MSSPSHKPTLRAGGEGTIGDVAASTHGRPRSRSSPSCPPPWSRTTRPAGCPGHRPSTCRPSAARPCRTQIRRRRMWSEKPQRCHMRPPPTSAPRRRTGSRSPPPFVESLTERMFPWPPVGKLRKLQYHGAMEGVNWLWWIIIGGIAGALAGRVVRGRGFGIIVDVIVGIVGAVIGGWIISGLLNIKGSGIIFSFIVAFLGAVLLLWVLRLVAPQRTSVG